jgi:hypothetical protein
MNSAVFLLCNLALAFYLAGAIWAHEVDIFRSWQYVSASDFPKIQKVHWRKLPFWIFAPLAGAFAGSIALIWFHPAGSPDWAIWANLGLQLASHILTTFFWGRWQGKLSRDPRGPASPYLRRILATHWLRTLLINAYALVLLAWTIRIFA